MEKCKRCGRELEENALFCATCGTSIKETEDLPKYEEQIKDKETHKEDTMQNDYQNNSQNQGQYTYQNNNQNQNYGYQFQQPYTTYVQQKTNGMCVAGFILSFFIPLLGLIFSIVGVSQASRNNESCKGLGIAGIVISGIACIIILTIVIPLSCAGIGATIYY